MTEPTLFPISTLAGLVVTRWHGWRWHLRRLMPPVTSAGKTPAYGVGYRKLGSRSGRRLRRRMSAGRKRASATGRSRRLL